MGADKVICILVASYQLLFFFFILVYDNHHHWKQNHAYNSPSKSTNWSIIIFYVSNIVTKKQESDLIVI